MRRWLTAGEPVFHDLGYYFTWALRSRVKEAGGMFRLVDANGKESLSVLVPGAPVRLSSIVSGDPYMLWVSAQRIARRKHVRVYATAMVKLNERQSVPLVDPTVDLAAEAFPLLGVPSWVR
jgi:hypothetical protein